MDRTAILRTLAVVLVAGLVMTIIATLHERDSQAPSMPDVPSASGPSPDALSAELRRCSALGPKDAEDPHCEAVWEENRRRFFGRTARPLPPVVAPAPSAKVTSGGVTP